MWLLFNIFLIILGFANPMNGVISADEVVVDDQYSDVMGGGGDNGGVPEIP